MKDHSGENTQHIKVDENGKLSFTEAGYTHHCDYFAYVGIDINAIKTLEQYKNARAIAEPHFLAYLAATLTKDKKGLEYRALELCLTGNDEELERIEKIIQRRNALNLTVIDGGNEVPS
ncbi:hypothetical protein [Alkalimarinus sediminis]|uniref:Uncharacterized protein n=1 Tax=Alkalimarinus sediminis TaxID=1632866 RepID=A0A9E8KRN4_9ALTE|nr:hypothetical protein [Alkalimarinus sediminis]UZW76595.1 hypothetical protein NNL22_08440 [Alkalimarinus sediminis]